MPNAADAASAHAPQPAVENKLLSEAARQIPDTSETWKKGLTVVLAVSGAGEVAFEIGVAIKTVQLVRSFAAIAATGQTFVRTEAANLAEKLALDEAKAGAGRRIMQGKINDPKYPEEIWAKMQHVHENPGGTQTVIHYWENLKTGLREGFKFK